jgi:acyl carrier protein
MDLQHIVISNIAELSRMKQADIRLEHTLVGDIKMDGDEFSFVFVPALEKALRIRTSQSDWDGVRSVGDIVEMLQRKPAG